MRGNGPCTSRYFKVRQCVKFGGTQTGRWLIPCLKLSIVELTSFRMDTDFIICSPCVSAHVYPRRCGLKPISVILLSWSILLLEFLILLIVNRPAFSWFTHPFCDRFVLLNILVKRIHYFIQTDFGANSNV